MAKGKLKWKTLFAMGVASIVNAVKRWRGSGVMPLRSSLLSTELKEAIPRDNLLFK